MYIKIHDHSFLALLDTGSTISIISSNSLAKIPTEFISVKRESRRVDFLMGNTNVHHTITLPLHYYGKHTMNTFVIMTGISKDIILGTDFLDKEKLTISIALGGWMTGLDQSTFHSFDYLHDPHTFPQKHSIISNDDLISFDEVIATSEHS